MTRELLELREFDAQITVRLKGPMSNIERALEVADRKDIRERIRMLEAEHATQLPPEVSQEGKI